MRLPRNGRKTGDIAQYFGLAIACASGNQQRRAIFVQDAAIVVRQADAEASRLTFDRPGAHTASDPDADLGRVADKTRDDLGARQVSQTQYPLVHQKVEVLHATRSFTRLGDPRFKAEVFEPKGCRQPRRTATENTYVLTEFHRNLSFLMDLSQQTLFGTHLASIQASCGSAAPARALRRPGRKWPSP